MVAQHAGEGHAHAIERLVEELEATHEANGTPRRGAGPYVEPEPVPCDLRFPGKVIQLPGGNLLVSDSTRHALVELAPDGETVVRRIGSGERGLADGDARTARFNEPQGFALLPVGPDGGQRVVVADIVNHALRGFDPATGTGRQWWQGAPTSGPAREVDLSSPWDVAYFADRLWIAMAGVHQLWTYDPVAGTVQAAAGTTNEGLVDGPAEQAWFAQPSGLAATADRLWIADSETSALRYVERDPRAANEADGTDGADAFVVRTAVGTGLFDFGHRDGPAEQVLFQHPLGVTALRDGSVAVSDTYNQALRRYDPATGEVSTLATDLREPSGAVLVGDDIVVVESARHRLTRLKLPEEAVRVESVAHRTQRAATEVALGVLRLDVSLPGPQRPEDWTPGTARPPGCWSARPRRSCWPTGRARARTSAASCGWPTASARASCTSRRWPPPATTRPTSPTRPATSTSRTGASASRRPARTGCPWSSRAWTRSRARTRSSGAPPGARCTTRKPGRAERSRPG